MSLLIGARVLRCLTAVSLTWSSHAALAGISASAGKESMLCVASVKVQPEVGPTGQTSQAIHSVLGASAICSGSSSPNLQFAGGVRGLMAIGWRPVGVSHQTAIADDHRAASDRTTYLLSVMVVLERDVPSTLGVTR